MLRVSHARFRVSSTDVLTNEEITDESLTTVELSPPPSLQLGESIMSPFLFASSDRNKNTEQMHKRLNKENEVLQNLTVFFA